jgi:GT2 family glycosyltransferase
VLPFELGQYRFVVRLIQNHTPKGFGANHNAAFLRSTHDVFCVVNPDIRLPADPFPDLLRRLADARTGVVAPLARSPEGNVEDSARPFPTPLFILRKALFGPPPSNYRAGDADLTPDWVGGMFMLFPRDAYAKVRGFDERYHLYYEDVDLCARLRLAGKEIVFCPSVEVLHDARRQSRHSLRYLGWHLASMLRFFTSAPFFRLVLARSRRSSGSGPKRRPS